jgi:membrane associated rhomboid family serine protease
MTSDTHLEGQKLIYDTFKHLSTLSSGSILLLATFIKYLFVNPKGADLIGYIFFSFIISIIFAIIVMCIIPWAITAGDSPAVSNFGFISYFVSVGGFLVGIILFAYFSWINFS